VAEAVKEVLAATPESVTLLAETTAGQGSSINVKFEDLAYLLELTQSPARLGVCIDTCHIFSAGYDIRTADGLDAVIQEFDRVVGLDRLRAIHLNDSKFGLGTRKDRHENIGKGEIGLEAFRALVNHPQLIEVPMFLETPTEEEGHEKDLTLLKSLVGT
jgi:deoxyribonuclease-4